MEYQKIANLIDDDALNQPSKFRTRNWVEINDESGGAYNVNSQIRFKTTMLKSSYNTISLSCHEQVCLMRLRFERYFSQHRAM